MFKTLVSRKRPFITLGKILFILLILSLIAVISSLGTSAIPYFYRYRNLFVEISLGLNFGLLGMLVLNGVHYVFFSKNNATEFNGTLDLKENAIVLNDKSILLDQIKSIRIKGNDIKGDFRGYISKGTNNEILIYLKNDEELTTKFQQTKTIRLQSKKSILEIYRNKGILSTANFDNIINNTNYY